MAVQLPGDREDLIDRPEDADNKPFLEATLAEHRASRFALHYAFEAQARSFLGMRDARFVTLTARRPIYDAPHVHRAIRACFPDWRLVRESGPPDARSTAIPISQSFLVRPGRESHFLTEGSRFFQLDGGERRIITWRTIDRMDCVRIELSLMGPRQHRRAVAREWSRLLRWIKHGPHYLRRQIITPSGEILPRRPRMTWDDVVLDNRVRDLVIEHTIEFLNRRQQFRRNHIPQRRGIILHGPPGTGKTMIGKVLAAQSNVTFILVGTGDIDGPRQVSDLFALARRLRPTIMFLEDFDFYGDDRKHNRCPQILGELLTELDGRGTGMRPADRVSRSGGAVAGRSAVVLRRTRPLLSRAARFPLSNDQSERG